MAKTTVTLYHDCRRPLDNGKFPVKVRVTFKVGSTWKQRYYSTGYSLSPSQWIKVKAGTVRGELRKLRGKIIAKEADAAKLIEENPFLSPDAFDALYTGRSTRSSMIKPLFDEVIAKFKSAGKVSTAWLYRDAMNALLRYDGDGLTLSAIDKDFLDGFETWMKSSPLIRARKLKSREPVLDKKTKKPKVSQIGRSPSTIGIYLRNLRTVFNIAIERKIVSKDIYPFGRRRYVIPSSRNVKKALARNNKTALVGFHSEDPRELRALSHWMFSYYCDGMNFTDMAYLTADNIHGDVLIFTRRKLTTRREAKPHQVTLRKECLAILRAEIKEREGKYIFGIITEDDDAEKRKRKINYWIARTNKFIGRIAKQLGIGKVTTYTARHTMATMLIQSGVDKKFVQDRLDHESSRTTDKYIASLEIDEQRKIMEDSL